jgi:PAS domain S-box-containing protein
MPTSGRPPEAGTSELDGAPSTIPYDEAPDVTGAMGAEAILGLVDAAPDGIVVADEHGSILFVNRRTEELFGYGRAELLRRPVEELVPAPLRQVHRAHRTRYGAEPRLRSMGAGLVLFARRADGSEFPVEIGLSPLETSEGLRVVAVVRDVTERVVAEREQREVREALDVTRDALLILDADTLRFTYANDGASRQVGYTRSELLRMTMLDITPELDERELRELLAPLERGERTSLVFATVHRHRDGTDIPVEILVQAIPGESDRPTRYVKIARDVRERLEAEERLRRAEQHLRVVEDRERIARDLHDTVIQKLFAAGMTLQGVSARTADPEHGRRLAGVVDDLDETIREIRSVIFGLQADSHDTSGVRTEILRIVDDERDALGFQPRIRFDGPVDAMDERVAADLLPTLREALSNVGKHADASSVEVVVDCGERVTLRVLDNGRGIPATLAEGHGLPNLRERARKLGGHCRVSSRPDGGTALEWMVPNGASSPGDEGPSTLEW